MDSTRFPKSIADLASFLNEDPGLLWRLITSRSDNYRFTTRRKKACAGFRAVQEPNPDLKRVQRTILRLLLRKKSPHPVNHGYPGRGIVSNARVHLGPHWVQSFDLRDAYPGTKRRVVRGPLRRLLSETGLDVEWLGPLLDLMLLGNALPQSYRGYGTPPEAKRTLMKLRNTLPQGAPTSAALLDLVMFRVDDRLQALSRANGGRYTRYADDMTFSGPRRMRGLRRRIIECVGSIGLTLNHEKEHTWEPGKPATITGLVLRHKVSVQDDILKRIEIVLVHLESDPGTATRDDVNRLSGLIGHVASVNPDLGETFQRRLRNLKRGPRPGP